MSRLRSDDKCLCRRFTWAGYQRQHAPCPRRAAPATAAGAVGRRFCYPPDRTKGHVSARVNRSPVGWQDGGLQTTKIPARKPEPHRLAGWGAPNAKDTSTYRKSIVAKLAPAGLEDPRQPCSRVAVWPQHVNRSPVGWQDGGLRTPNSLLLVQTPRLGIRPTGIEARTLRLLAVRSNQLS